LGEVLLTVSNTSRTAPSASSSSIHLMRGTARYLTAIVVPGPIQTYVPLQRSRCSGLTSGHRR
ncbi:MAG TPA: hypothetical protein VE219_02440, partial [Candidatus Sulfotelmatobacter sp.]|nr:hypothetical protein [Candidatus Sulfotelmatobacter sp.]